MTGAMLAALALVGFTLTERLAELVYARRNTARLRAAGAVEFGARHYPLLVLLHGAWLVGLASAIRPGLTIDWRFAGLFLLLQLGRLWIIRSLGRFWTTRVLSLPDAPLIRTGPYRFLRHPNYLLVVAEIAALPLAFGLVWQALIFSVLNGLLLLHRVRIEAAALAPRRAIEKGSPSCVAQPFRS